MRRIIVLVVICAAVLVVAVGVASAYPDDQGAPNNSGAEVGGIVVSRTVNAAGTPSSASQPLAFTGSDGTSILLWVGGGLVLAGGALVVITQRRRVPERA